MEFKDSYARLYNTLFHEYSLTSFFKNGRYTEFLNYKDIGVKYIECGVYEVVDEKKWFLARIKYGI